MLPLAIAAALFVVLFSVIVLYGIKKYATPAKTIEKIAMAGSQTGAAYVAASPMAAPIFKVKKMAQWVGERMPANPQEAGITQRFLIAAGFNQPEALTIFNGARVLSAAGCAFLGVLVVSVTSWIPLVEAIVVGASAVAGLFIPRVWLELLVSRRQDAIQLALPDALDLMVVCAESGLGLDQTLRVVADELRYSYPEISRELSMVSAEMRAGAKRAEALRNLADRTMVPEVRQMTSIMIQTDRFGTSIADSLRTHADFTRMRRRQLAEEKAGKLGVKLIFPIFFCIMPAIVILAIGPSAIRIAKELLPMLKRGM